MEGLSRHLHKQSSIKLHPKLRPLLGEKSRENLGESEKLCWVQGEDGKKKGEGGFLPHFLV